jgi:prepilin-type N-terminal cleavage/methylation domain-containing protein
MIDSRPQKRLWAFTLIELLVVIAIISILAVIGLVNFREATRRAEQAQCSSNLKTIGQALMQYRLDNQTYPLADGVAGTQDSQGRTEFGNGPAANGLWDGVPNALVRLGYLTDRNVLFCPSLSKRYPERRENLRYAYNASTADTGGFGGGRGVIDGVGAGGQVWLCRCLHINLWGSEHYAEFPHGPQPDPKHKVWGDENVLWSNYSVGLSPGSDP